MVVKHIDHITINVKDLGKTFAFYENVLGAQANGPYHGFGLRSRLLHAASGWGAS